MRNKDTSEISDFFDQDSGGRDKSFTQDRILGYEQEVRQQTLLSLISDSYLMGLDAGCGNGRDFIILLEHIQTIVGIDFSQGMVAKAKIKAGRVLEGQHIHLAMADVTRIPLRNSSFDFIACSEVLEHVPDWKKALLEFHRLLKPGGMLIVSTPNRISMYGLTRYLGRLLIGTKHPYDKWKSYRELRNALRAAGFEIIDAKGSCYLPGDISYYQPFKSIIVQLLRPFHLLDKTISGRWPFKLFGYGITVKCKKRHNSTDK